MLGHAGALTQAAALTLAALLPVINPPGSAPIFLSMTPGADELTRTALARRVGMNSALLLLAAMLVGSYVLAFFGLPLSVVKIAGGLLVSATGWRLISADQSADADLASGAPVPDVQQIGQKSFYPLTFPLTVGPGSISVAVTLGAGTPGYNMEAAFGVAGTIIGIIVSAAIIYLCYRFATPVVRALGQTGSIVLLRLSAFILLAVGVQIFCSGLIERFAPVLK